MAFQSSAQIKAELLLNGTWTDISRYVYQRDPVTITGGKAPHASKPPPATLTLTLNNRDGRFSPNNASGAYYPFVKRNTRIRLSVTVTSSTGNFYSGYRFSGKVPKWPPQADVSQTDVFVPVTAYGPLREIRAGGGKGSALTRYYATLTGQYAPIAYWPCEDDPDTTILGAGIEGGTNMSVTAGSPLFKAVSDFNGSAPIAVFNNSTWDGLTGSAAFSGDDIYTTPGTHTWTSPLTGNITVKVWGPGGGGGGAATISGAADGAAGSSPSTFTGDAVTITANPGQGGKAGNGALGLGGAKGTGSTAPTHFDGGAGAQGVSPGGIPQGGGSGGSGGTASAGNSGSGNAGGAAVTGGGPGVSGGTVNFAGGAGKAPSSGPGGGGSGGTAAFGGLGGAGGGAGAGEFATSTVVAVTAGADYSAVVGAGGQGGTGSAIGGNGAAGKVELVYTPPAAPVANVVRFIVKVPKWGGNSGKILVRALTGGTIARLEFLYQAGGKLQLRGYDGASVLKFDSGGVAFSADGQTLMVSGELTPSGTSVAWKLTAIQPGGTSVVATASGSVATASLGNVTEVIAGPNADITKTAAGHISVQYGLISLVKVSKALHGHHTEHTVDRLMRLAAEQALDTAQVIYAEGKDHFGFESGTQSWGSATNCTIAQSAVTAAGWPTEGTHSLLLTSTGGGAWYAKSPTGLSGQPVVPGDIVSIAADVYTPAALGAVRTFIDWANSAGTYLSTTNGTTVATAAGDVTTVYVTGPAPATAAFFTTGILDNETKAAGTLLYADHVRVSARMGPQQRHELHKFIEEIEDLEQGMVKELRGLHSLGFRTRISLINQSPVVTLDYSTAQVGDGQTVLTPVLDDEKVANDITVHRHKGSKVRLTLNDGTDMSVTVFGYNRKRLKAVAERDEQLLAMAQHLLNLGTVADERYSPIPVELARTEVATIMSALAGVEIGDMVQISNLASWYPSATAKQLVTGYTEVITPFSWNIQWTCMPESPYELSATSIRRW